MNSFYVTAVLVEEHRARLLRDAKRYRQLRAAKAGSRRYHKPTRRSWALR